MILVFIACKITAREFKYALGGAVYEISVVRYIKYRSGIVVDGITRRIVTVEGGQSPMVVHEPKVATAIEYHALHVGQATAVVVHENFVMM